MTECDHDWRVDPHRILLSNPPQRKYVCAKCGATKASGITSRSSTRMSNDPRDWPKAP